MKADPKIQPDNCEFLRKEVTSLRHPKTQDRVIPNPANIDCIQNYPELINPKDIKSFQRLTVYYRLFIPNSTKITKPLTKLL